MVSVFGRATVGDTGSRAFYLQRFRSVAVATLALVLLATPFGSGAEAAVTLPFTPGYQTPLSPGITYERGTMWTSGGRRQAVHVATVELRRPDVRIKSVLSDNKVVGKQVVRRMVDGRRRPGFRPMVAINGDMSTFGRIDAYAAPRSMAVSNRELLAAYPCVRPVLGVNADGSARIAAVRSHITLTLPGETEPRRVERLNTHRDDDAVVLFTTRFAKSTRTSPRGVEVILGLEGRILANGTQTVQVLRVRRGLGNTPIRPGRAVLSVNNPEEAWAYDLLVGQSLTLQTQVVKRVDKSCGGKVKAVYGWDDIVEAQGGNRFTVRDGVVRVPSREVYASGWKRHPRTGVGLTSDGRLLMVTVDGRRKGSRGVTLEEMGQLMVSLGAKHAFNLDGGGSTVMARFNRRSHRFVVANKPSDGKQRPATQALAAFHVTPAP
jgi:hypothetical protein